MASAFETVIRLQLDKYGPEAAKQIHIETARKGLAAFMAKQTARPDVMIEVDGRAATTEDHVKPFGVIRYRFLRMREIVAFALDEARRASAVDSGRYRASWFAMIDGREVALTAITPSSNVTISNDQPYARKIHVGARGFEAHGGIVEKVRQAVQHKYGMLVETNIAFLTLQGGWVLRKGLRKIHEGRRYGAIRNDARAGMEITYPSLELQPKFR